jgi:hypothetical protein
MIFYYTSCSVTLHVAFIGLLKKELRLQNQEITSQLLADMRLQLKELLLTDDQYKVLKTVTKDQNCDRAMIKLEKPYHVFCTLKNCAVLSFLRITDHRRLGLV